MKSPRSFTLGAGFVPASFDSRLERRLSAMKGQYQDETAFVRLLDAGDLVLYEVYELGRPTDAMNGTRSRGVTDAGGTRPAAGGFEPAAGGSQADAPGFAGGALDAPPPSISSPSRDFRPGAASSTGGDLLCGISILHPGKVGNEYFMTKGHFHEILGAAEVYYCLSGRGKMVMETPEGEWAVEDLWPGGVLYVPPRWAHRSVNTGTMDDLITFFVYPADAGHDYKTIETKGFRKRVLDLGNGPAVVDNPAWG